MPPTPHPCLWGVDSSEPLPLGCRGLRKDTALPRRGLSPLLGVRVPMLGGGGPWVCDQGLRFSATLPTMCVPPAPPAMPLIWWSAWLSDAICLTVSSLHGQR